MPKILITGNGFDLSFGLPTGYSDFIKICKKLQDSPEFDWKDLREDIVVLKNSEKLPSSEFSHFENFKERLNENTWFRYLSREYGINTWIDFEKHIEKALLVIQFHLGHIRNETFLSSGRHSEQQEMYYEQDIRQKYYETYLTFVDFKLFLIKEGYNPELNPLFLKLVDSYYVDFDSDKLFSTVLADLNKFRELFSDYLEFIITPLYEIIEVNEKGQLLKNITHHFTFNYTPTFKKLISDNLETTFIHGSLDNKKNIVLGIDEWKDASTDTANFIPFTKYFQKLNFGIDLKFVNDVKSKGRYYKFFFWGHSLDKSDSFYINEVFNRLDNLKNEGPNRTGKIIIVYHSDYSRFNIIKNLILIRGSNDILAKQRAGKLAFIQSESLELKDELNSREQAVDYIEDTKIY